MIKVWIDMLFLHGFTETCDIWDDFSRKLSGTFRIIAIDLPGHGMTGTFGEIHTMEQIVRVMKEVLDHLHIRECLVIGHSMGGYATLAFARLYPAMLRGIILFHSQAVANQQKQK
jgi:pimeloyl-ACP methyl ester carboxylesterase